VNVHQIVEAVLFAADAPLTPDEIARADELLDEDQVQEALTFLTAEYDDANRSFEVVELAEGYQILTRPEFNPYLERFDNVPRISRLSGPALETLAIIAYRQPIGRLEIEYIRGVGASGVIRTLQDRRLIDVVGRAEGLGRPLLYGTTRTFLEHFGFTSLEDLPRPDDLPVILRERIPIGLDGDEEEPPQPPEDREPAVVGAPATEAGSMNGEASVPPPAGPDGSSPIEAEEETPTLDADEDAHTA
jgi:segregation and condensation protein B